MSVFNRRNALIGYVTWTVGKRLARKKAKDAVPTVDPETHRPNKSAIALGAAAAGALAFWRLRSGDGDDDSLPPTE